MHCAVRFVVHTTYRTVHALHRCSTFVQQSFQRVVHGPAITSHAVWNQWPCNGSSARGTRPVSSRALVLTSVTTSTSTTRGTTDALTGARLADTTAPLLRPPPPSLPPTAPFPTPPPAPLSATATTPHPPDAFFTFYQPPPPPGSSLPSPPRFPPPCPPLLPLFAYRPALVVPYTLPASGLWSWLGGGAGRRSARRSSLEGTVDGWGGAGREGGWGGVGWTACGITLRRYAPTAIR